MRKLQQTIHQVLDNLTSATYSAPVAGLLAPWVAYLESIAPPATETERDKLVVGLQDCVTALYDYAVMEDDNHHHVASAAILRGVCWELSAAIYAFDR